jgi:hypothetical protein
MRRRRRVSTKDDPVKSQPNLAEPVETHNRWPFPQPVRASRFAENQIIGILREQEAFDPGAFSRGIVGVFDHQANPAECRRPAGSAIERHFRPSQRRDMSVRCMFVSTNPSRTTITKTEDFTRRRRKTDVSSPEQRIWTTSTPTATTTMTFQI